MSGADVGHWPRARLGNVARLRAIAATRPHLAYHERVVEAPFDRVWSIFGDLERGVPRFDRYVRWIRIETRDGERLTLRSGASSFGPVLRFEAIHRPGWCVMRARTFGGEVGMAADALADGRTQIAHFEGARWLGPFGRWLFGRTLPAELETVAALCRASPIEKP